MQPVRPQPRHRAADSTEQTNVFAVASVFSHSRALYLTVYGKASPQP